MDAVIRDQLRQSYDRHAAERDAMGLQDWKSNDRQHFLSLIQQEHKHSMLELGAGPGKDGAFYQANGLDVTCIDLSPEMVKLCRQKGLRAEVMDVADLQFPPSSFDAVSAINCLLHIPKNEMNDVLRGIAAVLKDEGLFYLGLYGGYDFEDIWNEDQYEPKRFFSFYTDAHIQEVASRFFYIDSFKAIETTLGGDELHFQSLILRKKKI